MTDDSPAAKRFLDLATRPIEDNAELHLAARADLARRIDASPAASEEALEEAAERLETADRNQWGRRLMAAFSVLAVAMVVGWVGWSVVSLSWLYVAYQLHSGGMYADPGAMERMRSFPTLTEPRVRLLLFGDESAVSDADKWRPLWESEPSNPVYFANYVGASKRTHGVVSKELLEEAGKLDPDNGWYLAFAAGSHLNDKVLERQQRSPADVKAGRRTDYKVLDESEYAIARDLFYSAATKPDFSDHSRELYHERFSHLPPAVDTVSNFRNVAYVAGQTSNVIQLRWLADLVSHESDRSVLANDEEAFRRTVAAWRWLVDGFNQSGATLVDGLVTKVILSAPLRNFRDAAAHFGMTEDAARFDTLHAEIEAERLGRVTAATPGAEFVQAKGSLLVGLSAPMIGRQVKSPPVIAEADLKPGRLADHSLAGRLFAGFMAFLLVLASGLVVAVRFRHGVYGRKLSERACALLRPVDWLWTGLCGLCLPLVWFLAITRLTPFSARDWNPWFSAGIPLIGQWVALAVLVFTASASAAAWRLDRRMRFLGRMPKSAWWGFAATVCAALAVPVWGAIPLDSANGGKVAWGVGLGLGGLVGIWWFAGLFSIATGVPCGGIVRRVAISRLLVPLWLAGALVFAAFSFVESLAEQHWVQRDTMLRATPDALGLSRYEGEVTKQLRKELDEIIARVPEL